MDRWKSCTSRYGAKATWHFFYEPVVKPVDGYVSLAKDFTAVTRFVTVDIHLDQDGMCCLRYGTLHGRPSPIDNALVELLRRDIPVFDPVFDDVEWSDYFLPQTMEPRAEDGGVEDSRQKQSVLIARAEMSFPLVQLQAVLLGILPRVAHAQSCRGVVSQRLFGTCAATSGLGVNGPKEGMPFTFFSKEGQISAVFEVGCAPIVEDNPASSSRDSDFSTTDPPSSMLQPVYRHRACVCLEFKEAVSSRDRRAYTQGGRLCEQCRALSNQAGMVLSRIQQGLSTTEEVVRGVFVNVSRSRRVQEAVHGRHWKVCSIRDILNPHDEYVMREC
jgi:hypothetical protein